MSSDGTQAYSSYFFLERVNSPVQLPCGRSDPLEARDKLVESGEEVQLILYEDEGYVFLNIHNVIHSDLMRVEFLEQVLETH